MKATLALVPGIEAQNRLRRLTFELDVRYQTGFRARILPPHVSLKQPFDVYALESLERYAETLSSSLSPFSVRLGRLEVWPTESPSMAVLTIEDTERLIQLHTRLNEELPKTLGHATPAPFDGDYRPHLTVAWQGADGDTYARIKREDGVEAFECPLVGLELFVYRERSGEWEWMTYRHLPLSQR